MPATTHTTRNNHHMQSVNIRIGIQYIQAWLRGNGAVALYHLMEDAAITNVLAARC